MKHEKDLHDWNYEVLSGEGSISPELTKTSPPEKPDLCVAPGFDPIDTRHRSKHYIHDTHVYPPDRIISTFDTPAGITVSHHMISTMMKMMTMMTSIRGWWWLWDS